MRWRLFISFSKSVYELGYVSKFEKLQQSIEDKTFSVFLIFIDKLSLTLCELSQLCLDDFLEKDLR